MVKIKIIKTNLQLKMTSLLNFCMFLVTHLGMFFIISSLKIKIFQHSSQLMQQEKQKKDTISIPQMNASSQEIHFLQEDAEDFLKVMLNKCFQTWIKLLKYQIKMSKFSVDMNILKQIQNGHQKLRKKIINYKNYIKEYNK